MDSIIKFKKGFETVILRQYKTKVKKTIDKVTGAVIERCGNFYLVKYGENQFVLYCINKYEKAVISKKDIKDAFWHNGELIYRKDDFHWYRKRGDGGKTPLGDDLTYFFAGYENKEYVVSYLDAKERWVKANYKDYIPFHDGLVLFRRSDGFFDIMQGKNRLLHKINKKEVVLFEGGGYYQIYRLAKTERGQGYIKSSQGLNYKPAPKFRLNLLSAGRKLLYWFIGKVNYPKAYG